jgi:hypothetical protein
VRVHRCGGANLLFIGQLRCRFHEIIIKERKFQKTAPKRLRRCLPLLLLASSSSQHTHLLAAASGIIEP